MASITTSGIGSGLNIQSLVSQLVAAERAPTENRLASREALAQARISGFGGLKSALTTFQESVAALQAASLYATPEVEESSGFVATSENPDLFTATAGSGAVAGTYNVEVLQYQELTANRLVSTDQSGFVSDNKFGELTIRLGNSGDPSASGEFVVENIKKEASLADIADAINSASGNTGDIAVTASVVSDDLGSYLVLNSATAGDDYNIEIEDTGGGGTANLSDFEITATENANDTSSNYGVDSAGQDAFVEIDVDGFSYSFANTSYTFADSEVLPGITINVFGAEVGQQYDLTVAAEEEADTTSATETAISSAVEDFVAAYNTLKTTLNDLTAFDSEANTQGLLNGDPTVRAIASRLRQELSDSVSGVAANIDTLAEIGVTTNVDDGSFEIDAEALSAALDGNASEFEALFSGTDGFATRLDSILTPYVQTGGLIDNRTDGLKSQIERIADQREALNRRIIGIEERYLRQFTALDTLLGELNNSSNFLTSQLANLPGAVPINKN